MPTNQGRDRTIAALYGAATGRVAWDESLSVLSDYLEVCGITLDTYDFEQSAGTVLATNLPPDPAILQYNEEFGRANPLIERSRRYLDGNYVFPASRFVRPEDFARTDLYNEVYRRLGIKYVAGMALDSGPEYTTHLTVIKPAGEPDFSERELGRMRSIHSHVREAYAGFRHIQSTRRDLARLTSLWDAVEHAVIVVGADMRVRFANRAAEAIASRPRTFFAASDELHLWLGSAPLVDATRSVLAGERDLRHLAGLSIGAFSGLNASIFRLDNGEVVLVISDPVRVRGPSIEALMQRFCLTPAEAGVVRAVIGGTSLRTLAEDTEVSYETVRSQLKHAMTKNGWRRQTEMVADVFSRLLPFGELDFP
jgi:DNA-binding CsgD family transcriptional regulator